MKNNEYTLKELKVAVINEDLKKLEELSQKIPSFSSIEEAKEIVAFLKEAMKILQKEKKKLQIDIKEIKKLKKFNSYNTKSSATFTA